MNLDSCCRVILPITYISSSVILRRNKKLNKKSRIIIKIVNTSILVIIISQNRPLLKNLVDIIIYYYKDMTSDNEIPAKYLEMLRQRLVDSKLFVRDNIIKIIRILYRFLMKGGSHKLFKQTIIISFKFLRWLIKSGNF